MSYDANFTHTQNDGFERYKEFTTPNGIAFCVLFGSDSLFRIKKKDFVVSINQIKPAISHICSARQFGNAVGAVKRKLTKRFSLFCSKDVFFWDCIPAQDFPKFFMELSRKIFISSSDKCSEEYKEFLRLSDWWVTRLLPELYDNYAPEQFTADFINSNHQEVTQMETNETIQAAPQPVTMADIEDIGERAEAIMKIYGVSKTDALRAVTQLKAQEINRDLSPLLELLR